MYQKVCILGAVITAVLCGSAQGETFEMVYVSLFPAQMEASMAAIDFAIQDFMEAGGLYDGHNVTYHPVYSTNIVCADELYQMSQIIEHLVSGTIDVVLGPTCSTIAAPAAWSLEHWNIAMFSDGATQSRFADKENYPNLIRLNSAYDKMGPACAEIMKHFQWDRAAILSVIENLCEYGGAAINENFVNSGILVTEWIRYNGEDSETVGSLTVAQIDAYLDSIRQRARIIWLCNYEPDMVNIMMRAHAKGMTNGDFVFIFYSLDLGRNSFYTTPWLYNTPLNMTDGQLAERRKAFYPLKQIMMAELQGPDVDGFRHAVSRRLLDVYNVAFTWYYYDQLGFLWCVFLYDATILYLTLLNETLTEGGDPRNGTDYFERSKLRRFQGKSGNVALDENADRDPDWWFFYNSPDTSAQTPNLLLTMSDPPGQRFSVVDPDIYWVTSDNQPPPAVPACGFDRELCPEDFTTRNIIIGVSASSAVLLILSVAAIVHVRRRSELEREVQQMLWRIDYEAIGRTSMKTASMISMSMRSLRSNGLAMDVDQNQIFTEVGIYNGAMVAIRKVNKPAITFQADDLLEMKKLRDMNHENLNGFIGACIDPGTICIITHYCSKGSLQDLLETDEVKLDWMFKCSLINDVSNGMLYIHQSFLQSHGHLRSSTCLVNSRWQVKITSFGLKAFKVGEKMSDDMGDYELYKKLLWTAPELLRMDEKDRPPYGTQKGDIYSFAILMQEIIYRSLPYFMEDLTPHEVIQCVIKSTTDAPYRPELPSTGEDIPLDAVMLLQACWAEDPLQRPDFNKVKKHLKVLNRGGRFNIMDNMLEKLEKYATNLEEIVEQRTKQLKEEQKKTDVLLYRMLPSAVADVLKTGQNVSPELFDSVTIYFSDIVGFTALSSESTPMQVVDLLNDLYTLFDDILERYDVYKVETIGDAYMIVSGLPNRNGNRHAGEIATVSLHLLSAVHTQFKIRHRPDVQMRLRIGLHTGHCAAGVVGLTMPRYCLFGDTVNMASRMESNGLPLRIHLSQDCHAALDALKEYETRERGEMPIKGKGIQKTYWLLGKQDFTRPLPPMDDDL